MTASKIVQLDIENVMRIKAVHIEPDGHIVVLGGRNAQGKTSVLDSISMALGGKRLCPDVPIREGQDEAAISLTLGDLQVTRTFKKDAAGGVKSALSVKNAKGQPLSPPQATLDRLIGRLAFDPLEFARMSPSGARETLRDLVGLDVEQQEIELQRVFDQRTIAGQEKRAAQAVVEDMPVPPEIEEELSADAVMDELAKAAQYQRDFEELKGILYRNEDALDTKQRQYETLCAQRDEINAKIAHTGGEIESIKRSVQMASTAVETFTMPDTDSARAKLYDIQEHNQRVAANRSANEHYQRKVAEAEAAAAKWKELDVEHNRIFHEIKKATEAVEYPIDGLELRKEGVYYNGVPFEQASRAQRIRVSMAMGVSMNKELGILLIRDGSVLDDEHMELLSGMAEEHDMQFWIEMARGYEGAAGAVIIEDGGVVSG